MYRQFTRVQTSLSVLFLCLFMMTGLAHANDALFTVRNVTVDVTAENALKAREQAFSEAQTQAFTELTERLALENDGAMERPMPDPITLAAMIKDYEVTQEQLSAVRYIGTYVFRFKSDSVRRYFTQSNVAYTDVKSDPLLILPFYQDGAGGADLWSHKNEWKQAWDRSDGRHSLVPLILPVGDLQDVRNIADEDALDYVPANLENMLERYQAKEAVIAIATPDAGFAEVSEDGMAHGSLRIDLYRTDYFRPEHVRQIFVTANGQQTRVAVFNQAVRQVKALLSKNWKEKSVAENNGHAGSHTLNVHVPITSLRDWMQVQNALQRVEAVQSIKVTTLTPIEATIDLAYDGHLERLQAALERGGLSLQTVAASPDATDQTPRYKLRLKHGAVSPLPARGLNPTTPVETGIPDSTDGAYRQSF